MCLEALIFEIRLIIKLVTSFLTGLLTAINRVVVCTLDASCKAGISCYGMIVEYMHREYCNMLFTFSASGGRAGTVAWEFALTIPVVIQTIILFRHFQHRLRETVCNNDDSCSCKSLTNCTEITHKWRCHTCRCGTRAVYKLTRFRKRHGTVRTEGPRNASWPSVESLILVAESTSLPRRSSSRPLFW